MEQYKNLVRHVLDRGTRKPNRTGVDTISTFGYYYEHNLAEGFPLLTTKAMSWKNIVVELLWFLSGRTDITLLRKHGCKFWDAWADEKGDVPSAYGHFWRAFPVPMHGPNDQIAWVLGELLHNPMSRRMVVSAWAPGNAQTSKLPPCHAMFALNMQTGGERYIDGLPRPHKSLCLHLTQRSCDVALGVPYNLASYALLLSLFARFADVPPGIFGHSLVDAHIYTSKPDGSMEDHDHVPGLVDQLARGSRPLPNLIISDAIRSLSDVEQLMSEDTDTIMSHFVLEGYTPHPAISFKVAV